VIFFVATFVGFSIRTALQKERCDLHPTKTHTQFVIDSSSFTRGTYKRKKKKKKLARAARDEGGLLHKHATLLTFAFLLSGSNQQQKGRVAEGFFFLNSILFLFVFLLKYLILLNGILNY
jgi:hypothetical protein